MGADDEMAALVKWIDEERARQNLTQGALAREAGIDSGGLSRIFAGQAVPMPQTLEALARALGYGYVSFLLRAYGDILGFEQAELMRWYVGMTQEHRESVFLLAQALYRQDEERGATKAPDYLGASGERR